MTFNRKNSGITSTLSTKIVVLGPFQSRKDREWRTSIYCLLLALNTEDFQSSMALLRNDFYFSRSQRCFIFSVYENQVFSTFSAFFVMRSNLFRIVALSFKYSINSERLRAMFLDCSPVGNLDLMASFYSVFKFRF